MTRSEGERTRLRHAIERMRATIVNVELAIGMPGPIGLETAGAVTITATEIATTIARLDTYVLLEKPND